MECRFNLHGPPPAPDRHFCLYLLLLPTSHSLLHSYYFFSSSFSSLPSCSQEACDEGNSFRMCPMCDESIGCNYWHLSEVCMYIRMAYLFDHPGTVFYAIFIAFWGEDLIKTRRPLLHQIPTNFAPFSLSAPLRAIHRAGI